MFLSFNIPCNFFQSVFHISTVFMYNSCSHLRSSFLCINNTLSRNIPAHSSYPCVTQFHNATHNMHYAMRTRNTRHATRNTQTQHAAYDTRSTRCTQSNTASHVRSENRNIVTTTSHHHAYRTATSP